MSTIAVVMATFNGEEWLGTQLQSLASQTRLPDRLIISDDGSTDSTVRIAEEFAHTAPFEVVLLNGPKIGDYGENFWSASGHANCDVIAWCDQDDYWYPNKLELCEQLMELHGVSFLSHSAMVTDANLTSTGKIFPHHQRTRVVKPLVGDPLHVAFGLTTLVRSELLRTVRWEERPKSMYYEKRIGHDEVVSLLSFATTRRLEVRDVLVNYRQHGQNFVGSPEPMSFLAKAKTALDSESLQYSNLAEALDRYGSFVVACSPQNTKAIEYFAAYKARCLRRSAIHQSPSRFIACRKLCASLLRGDYGRKQRGRFGALALARDAVGLVIS